MTRFRRDEYMEANNGPITNIVGSLKRSLQMSNAHCEQSALLGIKYQNQNQIKQLHFRRMRRRRRQQFIIASTSIFDVS